MIPSRGATCSKYPVLEFVWKKLCSTLEICKKKSIGKCGNVAIQEIEITFIKCNSLQRCFGVKVTNVVPVVELIFYK